MAKNDPRQILAQARRFAEDLSLFEGRHFIVPKESAVLSSVSNTADSSGKEAPAAEGENAPTPLVVESVVSFDQGDILDAFREKICECMRCPLGANRNQFVFGGLRCTILCWCINESTLITFGMMSTI